MKFQPKIFAYVGMGAATAFAMMAVPPKGFSPEALTHFFSEAAQNQIAQAGFFFTVAAWLHSTQVKNEIKSNFLSLTDAINNVAMSFREDLKKHSDELANLSLRVQNVENNLKQNSKEKSV